jgi:hypothetical protein
MTYRPLYTWSLSLAPDREVATGWRAMLLATLTRGRGLVRYSRVPSGKNLVDRGGKRC